MFSLSCGCLCFSCLFLAVPWVGLWYVMVAQPSHTHFFVLFDQITSALSIKCIQFSQRVFLCKSLLIEVYAKQEGHGPRKFRQWVVTSSLYFTEDHTKIPRVGSVPVFLGDPIAACDFPWGLGFPTPYPPRSGSVHEEFLFRCPSNSGYMYM